MEIVRCFSFKLARRTKVSEAEKYLLSCGKTVEPKVRCALQANPDLVK